MKGTSRGEADDRIHSSTSSKLPQSSVISNRRSTNGLDSLNDTCDTRMTSETAIRETQINFINDTMVPSLRPTRNGPSSRSKDKTKRSRVDIQIVPSDRVGSDSRGFNDRGRGGLGNRNNKRNGVIGLMSDADKRSVSFRQPLVSDTNKRLDNIDTPASHGLYKDCL